jgi:tetratricopeptide (TPR) repeat protein
MPSLAITACADWILIVASRSAGRWPRFRFSSRALVLASTVRGAYYSEERLKKADSMGSNKSGCFELVIICSLIGACVAQGASHGNPIFSSPVYRADDYYQGRRNLDNVRKGISILQAAVSQNPNDYQAWWRIAEYDCFLARHSGGKQEKVALREGIKAGHRAEGLQPGRPEGHFWTGANEGVLAEDSSLWTGLRLISPVRNEMQIVMKIDPNYQQDGAERILGRLYYEAPFFKGGDKQLSIRLLQDCLKRYPDNSLTLLYLADSYLAVGRRQDARKMLDRMLALCPDPIYEPELLDNQAAARERLKRYFAETR